MRKLRIYLDTSVISFLFADDAPDFKKVTVDFFEKYFSKYEVFISDLVIFEINRTKDDRKKSQLLKAIEKYSMEILEVMENETINRLATSYIKENIISLNKREDALHIATATCYEMDILLSWNFKHLANIQRQIAVNSVNEREGYLKKLNLLSPLEVENEE